MQLHNTIIFFYLEGGISRKNTTYELDKNRQPQPAADGSVENETENRFDNHETLQRNVKDEVIDEKVKKNI